MEKYSLVFFAFVLLITNATATKIILTTNATEAKIGETIKLHIEIYPEKSIGGTFSVNQETRPMNYKLVHTFFSRNSCPSCARYNPLSENLISDYYFIPKTEGFYFAVANFGNVTERVNFTVVAETTTTVTTTTTTTIPKNFCESDSDCACGKNKETGDCFFGNKNYVNVLEQCPDFCNGIGGNLEIKCIANECRQVQIPRTTMPETTTTIVTTITLENEKTCSTCASYTWAKVFLVVIIIIYVIYIIRFSRRKKNEKPAASRPSRMGHSTE